MIKQQITICHNDNNLMLGRGEFGTVDNINGVAVKFYNRCINRIRITPDIIKELHALTILTNQ